MQDERTGRGGRVRGVGVHDRQGEIGERRVVNSARGKALGIHGWGGGGLSWGNDLATGTKQGFVGLVK